MFQHDCHCHHRHHNYDCYQNYDIHNDDDDGHHDHHHDHHDHQHHQHHHHHQFTAQLRPVHENLRGPQKGEKPKLKPKTKILWTPQKQTTATKYLFDLIKATK